MEYFKQGDRTNGSYTIRPDVELHSFEVICEFTENSGYTIIKPENWPKNGFTFPEKSESRCTDPNCYHKKIEYGASKNQIKVRYHVIYGIRRLHRCWWQADVGDFLSMNKIMCLMKLAKPVTNISKLSATHFITNISHQHRCSRREWIMMII